ncbi:unnamed protein product, partial [marine sediment metagenome]
DSKKPDALTIAEMAGPRWAIVQALAQLLDERGAGKLCLHHLGCDREMAELARSFGWRSKPRGFHGTVGIIDPLGFWQACAPLFAERLGAGRAGRLRLAADGPLRITCGDEQIELDGTGELTNLVFLAPHRRSELATGLPPGSDLAAMLNELFPLPLVDYGLNYI